MKKGIRYLRFSHDNQSLHSIERQELVTDNWMNYNNVLIVDSFKDEGFTARTFDRPDVKLLFDFIKKNHRGIDYLIVSELTRFSREAGEAITLVEKIQKLYGVKIVSAGRGAVYDCFDHNSFFMMGLEFLQGKSENIKRTNDINGGIYTAKTKGNWIQGGSKAPYGYRREYYNDERGARRVKLTVNDEEAAVVRYIYDAFLANTPQYIIDQRAKELGMNRTGHDAVKQILSSPVYFGYQEVKPWKENAGGLYRLTNFTAIIDGDTWHRVREKLQKPEKARVAIADDFPLRGVLHCHCHKLLTAAPSRGRHGKYYGYYKCQVSGHNTISTTFAHKQLNEALGWMSLPEHMAVAIRERSFQLLEERTIENKKLLQRRRAEFDVLEKQLHSVEEKFINEVLQAEAYHRWHNDLNRKRIAVSADIEKLSRNENELYYLLQENLLRLTDLQAVWADASTIQKQELLRMGFDNGLYYRDGVYRTPYVMPVFRHNELILREKKLLVIDGKEKTGRGDRSGGGHGFSIEPLHDLLSFIHHIRVA